MGSFLMLAIVGALMGAGIVSGVMDQVEQQVRDVVNEELDNFEEEFEAGQGQGGLDDLMEASQEDPATDDVSEEDAEAADDDIETYDIGQSVSEEGGLLFGQQAGSQEGGDALQIEHDTLDESAGGNAPDSGEDAELVEFSEAPEDESLGSEDPLVEAGDNGESVAEVLGALYESEVVEVPGAEATADELEAQTPQLVIESVDPAQDVLIVEAEWVFPESETDEGTAPVDVRVETGESWLDVVLTDHEGQEAVVRAETSEPEELQVVVVQNDREVARV